MSPLAHRVARNLTLPIKDRNIDDRANLLSRFSDLHCFDITNIGDITYELAEKIIAGEFDATMTAFLPAERTWIEIDFDGARDGWLLEQTGPDHANITTVLGSPLQEYPSDITTLHGHPRFLLGGVELFEGGNDTDDSFLYAALALINTPRLIGRRQHMPHKGLEKKLAHSRAMVGKFPLHAWTELTLEAGVTRVQDDGSVHEAHLTGQRCLHFCRAHLRVRNGKMELVKPHWRGDPALGMKRTRYRLVPPSRQSTAMVAAP